MWTRNCRFCSRAVLWLLCCALLYSTSAVWTLSPSEQTQLQEILDLYKARLPVLVARIADLESKLKDSEAVSKASREELLALQEKSKQWLEELTSLQAELKTLQDDLATWQTRYKELSATLSDYAKQLQDLQTQMTALTGSFAAYRATVEAQLRAHDLDWLYAVGIALLSAVGGFFLGKVTN